MLAKIFIIVVNIFMTGLIIFVIYNLYNLIKRSGINIIDYQFGQIKNSKGWKKSVHRLVLPMLFIGFITIFVILSIMWSLV
jgi:hypothetical protein